MPQMTVLVVDDEPGIRESLRRLLLRAGWRATTAASSAEAVAALSLATPDAAILDVRMPDDNGGIASGLELLAFLRTQPVWRALPVIVLTGHFLTPDEDALVQEHGATVLYKPADLHAIANRLTSLHDQARNGARGTV